MKLTGILNIGTPQHILSELFAVNAKLVDARNIFEVRQIQYEKAKKEYDVAQANLLIAQEKFNELAKEAINNGHEFFKYEGEDWIIRQGFISGIWPLKIKAVS